MQKEKDIAYGLLQERPTKIILERVFEMKLRHSLYNYSTFDYFDTEQHYIFEIKNYTYSYDKYKYEIIGCNKGLCDNSILVFRHEHNDNEIYFIQFNKELFKSFNARDIWYRGTATYCYDIPKQYITKILVNEKYKLNDIDSNNSKIYIDKDKNDYMNSKQ